MYQKLLSKIKPLLKSLLVIGLVAVLAFSQADSALAARSGGRIGGGSFRMPTRSYSGPTGSPARGGYYGGGGFGFPFLLPFFGFGGGFGGLFTIFIVIAIANFLVNTLRRAKEGDEVGGQTNNPAVTVGRVQVGLLAEARSLQTDLDRIAQTADTGSAAGRAQVLQEATLSLLRHPEYWVYGAAKSEQGRLDSAEAKFNQWALTERSKFTEETLSNYNNKLNSDAQASLPGDSSKGELAETAMSQAPGEYIVVTIVVGTEGKMQMPAVNNAEDLRRALSQIGAISSEQLLAVEVLWTPQASGDSLTSDDMLAEYADLKLV
jgi:uncharacterized membrane protein